MVKNILTTPFVPALVPSQHFLGGAATVLIPGAGTRESQQFLIGLSMIAAVLAAVPPRGGSLRYLRTAALAVVALVPAWALMSAIAEIPWQVVAYGRRMAPMVGPSIFIRNRAR